MIDRVLNGNVDGIEALLKNGADKKIIINGKPLVFHAIERGHNEVAKLLINSYDNLYVGVLFENAHINVMQIAALTGNFEICRFLIEDKKMDPNPRFVNSGSTALMLAIYHRNNRIVV